MVTPHGITSSSISGCGGSNRSNAKDVMSLDRRMDRRLERNQRTGAIQIRKVRKWHQLQSKRTCGPSPGITQSGHHNCTLKQLCQSLCTSTPTDLNQVIAILKPLQEAISNHVSNMNHQNELDDILASSGLVLLQRLSTILSSVSEQAACLSAQCLTNLAASSTNSNGSTYSDEEESYYGPATSWCTLMVQSESQVMMAWIQVVSTFTHNQNNIHSRLLVEQCCWALGNIAGDSSIARQQLLSPDSYGKQVIQLLQQTLEIGLRYHFKEISRNAAWALGNLARGANTSAWLFINPNLTPILLTQLLSRQQQQENKMVTEGMWWLAFLTARETNVCELFLQHHPKLISAILHQLGSVAHVYNLSTSTITTNSKNEATLALAIPTLRVVGNLASCGYAQVSKILLESPATIVTSSNMTCSFGNCAESLARIVIDATPNTVAMEAIWVVSTLLQGRKEQQPASLTQAVLTAFTSPKATLNIQREALSTLLYVYDKSSLVFQSSSNHHTNNNFLSTCVHVLTCPDANAVQSSLLLLKELLQLNNQKFTERIRIQCEEANIVDALEHICDQSSHTHIGQSTWPSNNNMSNADIAADLLDDYFDTDDSNMDDVDDYRNNIIPTFTTQNGTQFGFGVPTTSANTTTSVGRGRGRGKVLPAWMQMASSTPQPRTV